MRINSIFSRVLVLFVLAFALFVGLSPPLAKARASSSANVSATLAVNADVFAPESYAAPVGVMEKIQAQYSRNVATGANPYYGKNEVAANARSGTRRDRLSAPSSSVRLLTSAMITRRGPLRI